MGTVTSVNSQRERLPPPAVCEDPIVGIWKSHNYNERERHWTQFTITVERVGGSDSDLKGTIVNHAWDGDETQEQPPTCDRTDRRFVVSMDAMGRVNEGVIEFWGIGEWRLDRMICGLRDFGYNLDHFTGSLDAELQEFQSVNNDGGIAIDEPTVFRRIKCFDDKEPVAVETPPFQPPRGPSLGCGWW